ncbi:MAG: hypothetical protein KY467_07285 [Gemmatimonadetes bacterium]|nr:hypothetical protein [Gemmatimonadota bacterium]
MNAIEREIIERYRGLLPEQRPAFEGGLSAEDLVRWNEEDCERIDLER